MGFPAVIKPIHGAASLGVLRVDSKESLATAYDKVRAVLAVRCIERRTGRWPWTHHHQSVSAHAGLPFKLTLAPMLLCPPKSHLNSLPVQVCEELAATIIENGVVRQATPEELAKAKVSKEGWFRHLHIALQSGRPLSRSWLKPRWVGGDGSDGYGASQQPVSAAVHTWPLWLDACWAAAACAAHICNQGGAMLRCAVLCSPRASARRA